MKLIRFSTQVEAPMFGVAVDNHALAFNTLQQRCGTNHAALRDSRAYLEGLPASAAQAQELAAWAQAHLAELPPEQRPLLDAVRLHPPVEVAALFDFGLTPRHLANSVDVMTRYEADNPQTAPLLQALRQMLLRPRVAPPPGQPERLSYYKSNLNAVCGDRETVPWPLYTSRLDIEPELAFVYGNAQQPVAGFCIFNDVSARDVQAAEILGGFCLSKDMAKGNQLGPFLVTPDEVGNAYALAVTVTVDGQPRYRGNTSELSHKAEDVIAWMNLICPLQPGTVVGMGTIPDCTGLDGDDFVDPGAQIAITFERLGTLHCRLAEPTRTLMPSRWPLRPALQKYHVQP
jgi:2-keto-4-pentenoate hydratase/2-oxohepta-3-ene-1,7-dioic acid hydratase in catechol pathway